MLFWSVYAVRGTHCMANVIHIVRRLLYNPYDGRRTLAQSQENGKPYIVYNLPLYHKIRMLIAYRFLQNKVGANL